MKKYKSGFSFAEIMISLVVVGIISMLVIPNLLDDSTNRTNETAASKAKYDVSQAAMRLQADCPRYRGCGDGEALSTRLRGYLNPNSSINYVVGRLDDPSGVEVPQIADYEGPVFEVLVDVDDDDKTDISIFLSKDGTVLENNNCNLNMYLNGNACNDNAIIDIPTILNNDATFKRVN